MKRVTEAQLRALERLAKRPLEKTCAGWCERDAGGINAFQTATINSLAAAGLVKVSRSPHSSRRSEAAISTAGRNYLLSLRGTSKPLPEGVTTHAA